MYSLALAREALLPVQTVIKMQCSVFQAKPIAKWSHAQFIGIMRANLLKAEPQNYGICEYFTRDSPDFMYI